MKWPIRIAAGIMIFVSAAPGSAATYVTYQFAGRITSSGGGGPGLPKTAVGSYFSGTFTYDLDATDDQPTDSHFGHYSFPLPESQPVAMSYYVQYARFSASYLAEMEVQNVEVASQVPGEADLFSFNGFSHGPNGTTNTGRITFIGRTPNVFTSDRPPVTLDLANFTARFGGNVFSQCVPRLGCLGRFFSGEIQTLRLVGGPAGDYNNDGTVDAADYVVWRKNPGGLYAQNDYNLWRANFGESAGSAAGATGSASASANPPSLAVPELSGIWLAIVAIAVGGIWSGRRSIRFRRVAEVAAVASVSLLMWGPIPANAVMFNAASVSELIAAIEAANQNAEPDSIMLSAATTFTLAEVNNTTNGATGLPTIAAAEQLTIVGNGAVIERSTAVESPRFRLLNVAAGASLTLHDMTLQGGLAIPEGGAIYNKGDLTLTDVILEGNRALGHSGGRLAGNGYSANGGGIYSIGNLLLESTIVQNNKAEGGRGGPGFCERPNLCYRGGAGGRGSGGGLYIAGGTGTLRNSIVTTNAAQGGAGGSAVGSGRPGYPGLGYGGGIYIESDAAVGLDDFTLAHVTSNTASTDYPNIRGPYQLIPNQMPGDFNDDGTVDAADYVVWRKGMGNTHTQNDYNTWRANFGTSLGPGSGLALPSAKPLSAAVPEPSAVLACISAIAVASVRRRRRATLSSRTRSGSAAASTNRYRLTTRAAVFTAGAVCLTVSFGQAAAAALFMGLGDLPGGAYESTAADVSADGAVVVGISAVGAVQRPRPLPPATLQRAFRWTKEAGMVSLGTLLSSSRATSYGNAIAADGSTIVGMSGAYQNDGSLGFIDAFRWTQDSHMVSLGDFPGLTFSTVAAGVSADGSVIVGHGRDGTGTQAFRWTSAAGIVGLGHLPGSPAGSFSYAFGVSADGSVVAGRNTSNRDEAFRWTQGEGMVGLGDLPGGLFASSAEAVSADGSVIVGYGTSASGMEAFRWTQARGMVGLGHLPGGDGLSQARAVSADGSMIVGFSTISNQNKAFIWDAAHGMRNLRDLLVNDFGLSASLAGWTLASATGISADGRVIVGSGTNPNGRPEAWIAELDAEPSISGDFNLDGSVDAADYVVWRKGLGTTYTQNDYNTWRANFGQTAGSIATGDSSRSANAIVPELSTPLFIAIVATMVGGLNYRRRNK